MSTLAEDTCPYCLRFAGFVDARVRGVRFCPECGSDWESIGGDALPAWREDSVVLPLPVPPEEMRGLAERDTGSLPALSRPEVRAAAPPLRLTPPVPEQPAWSSDEPAPEDRHGALFPEEGAERADGEEAGLADCPTPALDAPPAPGGSPWALVFGAAAALALLVVGLVSLGDADAPGDPALPPLTSGAQAPPVSLPGGAQALATPPATIAPAPPPPSLPPLPTPRISPERRAAAVKENIERALREQPPAVRAEVGVRVEEGVAFLLGQVDSQSTLDLVSRAAGGAFGVKAVDARGLHIEAPKPTVHLVMPGETLSAVARRFYGQSRQWRRIYEVNPGIDPNVIKVGQPLRLPDGTATH